MNSALEQCERGLQAEETDTKVLLHNEIEQSSFKVTAHSNKVLPQSQRHKKHGDDVTALHILGGTS